MFTKNEKYYFNGQAIQEPRDDGKGKRNKRSVWNINTEPYKEAHFATFPKKLIEPCILSSTREGDYVLDPFFGSGTVGVVCEGLKRKYIGIELHPKYIKLASNRINITKEYNDANLISKT
ncbi:MAG: site-specific DNA-methyltransferase, partial [bacterium]|nr:site-specific DNA-methyltransferase [bacterium]